MPNDRPRKVGRSLLLDNGTTWPDVPDERLRDAVDGIEDRATRYHLRAILGAYDHLAAHPAGTNSAVQSLRSLRRAVQAVHYPGRKEAPDADR